MRSASRSAPVPSPGKFLGQVVYMRHSKRADAAAPSGCATAPGLHPASAAAPPASPTKTSRRCITLLPPHMLRRRSLHGTTAGGTVAAFIKLLTMKALLQRVSQASVSVAEAQIANIGPGLLVLVGFEPDRLATAIRGAAR